MADLCPKLAFFCLTKMTYLVQDSSSARLHEDIRLIYDEEGSLETGGTRRT